MADAKEQQLQRELGECVMGSSWIFCVLGLGLAIPIGIKTKSYNPVVYLGLSGTLLDLLMGYSKCQRQREALASYQAAVKAFGVAAASPTSLLLDADPPPPPTPFGMAATGGAGAEVESLIAATEAARRRQKGSDNGEFQ